MSKIDKKDEHRVVVPQWVKAVSGSLGGATEALCLNPLDVTKTRMQLDRAGKYKGVINTGTVIVREEGVRALYKGLSPFVTHLTLKYALRMYTFGMYGKLLSLDGKPMAPWKNFTSGLLAGCTEAVLVVTPFEVIKMRLQQQVGINKSELKYTGPIDCFIKLIREEGPTALMKGVVPTMLRNGSNQALNFLSVKYVNEAIWGKTTGDGKQLYLYQTIISGLIGGSLGPCANCPADVVKTRLQCQATIPNVEPKYKGFLHAVVTIAKEEGITALYKGLSLRLMRIAPGQAIMWSVVTRIETMYEQRELTKLGIKY